jgi:hypothetical protein
MTILRFALLLLLAVLALVCPTLTYGSSDKPPAAGHETVEERWPDGTLRQRKQVLRLEDGTTVDDGPFERWHSDGTMEYKAVFVFGKKEGTTLRYHRNGRIASRQHYQDGRLDGPSVSWDDSGRKVKEENWADGQPHGTWTVWKDGKIAWTHTFDHGDPDPEETPRGNNEEAPQRSMVDGDPVPDSGGPVVDGGRQRSDGQ